jgi:protein-S-isoprenylcysteine O-methyltransferase Ste14
MTWEMGWRLAFAAVAVIIMMIRVHYDWRQYGSDLQIDWVRPALKQFRSGLVLVVLLQFGGYEMWPMRLGQVVDLTIRTAGLVSVLIGAILFAWSRIERESTWAGSCTKPDDIAEHFLCTSGPYRYVRHPHYGGIMLGIAGFELMIASWLLLVMAIVFFWEFTLLAKTEERDLTEKYGDQYRAYMKQAPWRFIPFVV